MKVKSMYVRVGADTKDMERALKGARAKMKAFGSQIKKVGKVMAVAGVAITGAVMLMAKKTIDKYVEVGDAIDKMSKRTGFSAESLSELAYAADISGTNLDTVEKAVKKMAKTIVEADEGMATYVRAFDRIGLSAEELIDLSPEKQFDRITMAIADLENPTLRAAAAQEIFGRAGTELLPLMAEGAEGMRKLREEAHRLGYVFDEETAAKAAKLKDAQTALKKAFEGVAFTIVSETIPVLTILTKKFTDVFVGIREEGRGLSSMIVGFFDVIVKATGGVLTGFKAFYISMLKLNKTLAEILIRDIEAIEYAAAMSKNYLIMAKILPLTADALAKLNKMRELDIDLIEKEEEALVNLMGVFADLRKEIASIGDAYKNMAGIVVDTALPATRDLLDVFEMMVVSVPLVGRSVGDILGKAVTKMTSPVYEYKKTWQETMGEILAGVSEAVGAMDSVFGQFHANEAQRLENEGRQQTDALESWYEREQARIERTISNEEDKVAALEALDEEKARKENTLQVKMDKERRKLARAEAKAKKASGLFGAGINIAEAITKALAQGGFVLGTIFSAVVAALGAVQIAAIAAAPLPSLKMGGMIEKEGIYRLHPGEEVRSAAAVAATVPASVFHTYLTINTKTLNDYTINRAAEKIFAAVEREKMRHG